MTRKYKGSCLCKGIKYEVTDFGPRAANCHCTMCRKFHGAAFGTLVPVSGLNWLTGQDLLKEYTAPNGTIRTFCSDCGSSIGFRVKGASVEHIELAIGTFDGDIPVDIDASIYTNFKANWSALQEDIPKYSNSRDS